MGEDDGGNNEDEDKNEDADKDEDKDSGEVDETDVGIEGEVEAEEEAGGEVEVEEGGDGDVEVATDELDVEDNIEGPTDEASRGLSWCLCSCRSIGRSTPSVDGTSFRNCGGDNSSSCSGKEGRDRGGNFKELGRGMAGDDAESGEVRGERASEWLEKSRKVSGEGGAGWWGCTVHSM